MTAHPLRHALLGLLRRPMPRWLASAGVLLLSVFGVVVYAGYVDRLYPIADWLAWHVLTLWAWVALANLAWLALGNWIVVRLLAGRELPLLESLVVSAAVGVVGFVQLMYLAGALGLYGRVFAVALPVLLIALGARDLLRLWRRFRRESAQAPPASPMSFALWGLGACLTAVVYLGMFTPEAINYDASWCHLTVAQDYAREHGIVAFPGDYNKNVPQLAPLVHTWGFSVPGLGPPQRWMLALHQEFALFVWTLAGVAAAVRYLVKDDGLRAAWLAFYLSPMIFVYDSNMGGAADHIAAFFALPSLLCAARLLDDFSVRRGLLLAACMAGAFLTKYQAVYWILPLALVIAGRWLWLSLRLRRQRAGRAEQRAVWFAPLLAALAFLLLVSPHFLRNWVFYRNPVYPLLQQVFVGSRPTVEQGQFLIANLFTDLTWIPSGTFAQKLWHALGLSLTFSFEPHYSFTKNFPAFGSLFSLLLPAVLLIRDRARVSLAVFVGFGALVIWGLTYNVDRNLQIFAPILAAATGALLIHITRLGRLATTAVLPLVLFQVVWGADAVIYSSHARLQSAFDLIRSGFEGKAKTRFASYRSAFVTLSRALPKDAKVLLHTSHVSLGIDRPLLLDWAGFQGLVSYAKVRTAREAYDLYKRLGVTHVLYTPGERPASSLQEEVVFYSLIARAGRPVAQSGGMQLIRLPDQPPLAEAPYEVAVLGAYGYGSGVFRVEKLGTNEYVAPKLRRYEAPDAPAPTDSSTASEASVDAFVVASPVTPSKEIRELLQKRFSPAIKYPGFTLHLPRQR